MNNTAPTATINSPSSALTWAVGDTIAFSGATSRPMYISLGVLTIAGFVACYLGESADAVHRAWSINVLSLREDRIRGITSFLDADLFARFGLPPAKA